MRQLVVPVVWSPVRVGGANHDRVQGAAALSRRPPLLIASAAAGCLDGLLAQLFVGQIPKTYEEADARAIFAEFGEVSDVAIIRDRATNYSKGACFIKYMDRSAADAAIATLHEKRRIGDMPRPLQVRQA